MQLHETQSKTSGIVRQEKKCEMEEYQLRKWEDATDFRVQWTSIYWTTRTQTMFGLHQKKKTSWRKNAWTLSFLFDCYIPYLVVFLFGMITLSQTWWQCTRISMSDLNSIDKLWTKYLHSSSSEPFFMFRLRWHFEESGGFGSMFGSKWELAVSAADCTSWKRQVILN